DLLVPKLRFRVLLDDLPAGTRRVRICAKRPDTEVTAHRRPCEAFRHVDRIELVDVHEVHAKASPTVPPTTKTIVPSSAAPAVRKTSGGTKTSVPAGASASSSPTVNRARPRTTA